MQINDEIKLNAYIVQGAWHRTVGQGDDNFPYMPQGWQRKVVENWMHENKKGKYKCKYKYKGKFKFKCKYKLKWKC